jgi:hypothetical protein
MSNPLASTSQIADVNYHNWLIHKGFLNMTAKYKQQKVKNTNWNL